MEPLAPLTFRGRHVALEPLSVDHVDDLVAAASESRETYAFTLVPNDAPAMRAYVDAALAELARGESMPFVVRDARGRVSGSTRFMQIERWKWLGPPVPPVPEGPDAVEIGYTWYRHGVQHTALNTEAKLILATHAFERWKVRRLTWKTHASNERSRRAILRIGARFDGVLRCTGPAADGSVRDTAYFSMLAEEWPTAKRALVAKLEDRRADIATG